jgi:hypothetical protein
MRWSRWWGGRVDAIVKGGGGGAPLSKPSRWGSVFALGLLTIAYVSSWVLADAGTRWLRWWGGRVDAIAKGEGGGAPLSKLSRRGSVFALRLLTAAYVNSLGPGGCGYKVAEVVGWPR